MAEDPILKERMGLADRYLEDAKAALEEAEKEAKGRFGRVNAQALSSARAQYEVSWILANSVRLGLEETALLRQLCEHSARSAAEARITSNLILSRMKFWEAIGFAIFIGLIAAWLFP